MDGEKFDDLSRSLASRANRRQTLRAAGKGGLFAAAAGALGLGGAKAANSTQPVDCTMPFLSKAQAGKNKGHRYDGDLKITIETDGAIDNGTLTTADGTTYDVVGQTDGRSIQLRVKLGADRVLALFGTAEEDLVLCRGRVDGVFSGWAESDLGTWTLGVKPAAPTPTATPTEAATNNGGGGGGGSTGGGNSSGDGGGTGNPTATPCPAQDCGGGPFVWLPDQCACGCLPPTEQCGASVCCPGGATCDSASGNCSCPAGTEFCVDSCVPVCASGSNRNFTTCQCETQTSCGTGETLCNGACVSINCSASQLFDSTQCMCVNRCSPGQGFCGGSCIDIVNDRNNCGSCGNVCQTGVPCIAGICTCPPGTSYNSTQQKCV
jgi:hypothetical protein